MPQKIQPQNRAKMWHVEKEKTSDTMCKFQYSLKPIIYLVKLLGIQLDNCAQNQTLFSCKILLGIIGCSVLFLNLIISISWLIFRFRSEFSEENDDNETTLEDERFDLEVAVVPVGSYISKASFIFGVHLTFYIISLNGRLKNLWASLLNIQNNLKLNEEFYKSIRKKCLVGLVFFILVNI